MRTRQDSRISEILRRMNKRNRKKSRNQFEINARLVQLSNSTVTVSFVLSEELIIKLDLEMIKSLYYVTLYYERRGMLINAFSGKMYIYSRYEYRYGGNAKKVVALDRINHFLSTECTAYRALMRESF